MSDWTIQKATRTDPTTKEQREEVTLVAPNGVSYRQESENAAKAIKGEIDGKDTEIASLKAEKAAAYDQAMETWRLEAEHAFADFFKEREASVKDKRARGEKIG